MTKFLNYVVFPTMDDGIKELVASFVDWLLNLSVGHWFFQSVVIFVTAIVGSCHMLITELTF